MTTRVTNSQVALSLISDGLGGLTLACILGFTSTALLSMEKDPDIEISEEEGSWIGATVPGAALIGSLLASFMLDSLGRILTLKVAVLPLVAAWSFLAYATTAWQVIVARTLSGLCLGIQQVAATVYASESIHSKLKGKFAIVPVLTTVTGFVGINIVGTISGWRGMAWVGFYISTLLFSLLFFLPETPYFLVKSGQKEKCLEVLKWLRPTEADAQLEFQELSMSESKRENKNDPSLSEMLRPPFRWPFLVAIFLHIFQQGTGVSPITTFTGIIFVKSGCDIDPGISGVISAVSNIAVIMIVGQQMEKYKRKQFINLSSIITISSLLSLALYIYVRDHEGPLQNFSLHLSYWPFVCFIVFMVGFAIGWAPIPWMYIGDSLPLQIRGPGAGIVIATNWALNFIFTKSFNWIILLLGHHNVYILYAGFTLLGTIVMQRQIPETFGFNDAKLQKYYEDSYKKKKL